MTSKTITDRAGDTLRVSTGSLTALPSEVTIKVIENARDRRHVAAVHVDPRELRAALDEVAPLGKYTRTTPDPDDMDGGVAAALIEKEAEQHDAAESRPLTPDAITDEMVLRFMNAYDRLSDGSKDAPTLNHFTAARTSLTRSALIAALTEPPVRPEGAEEIKALVDAWKLLAEPRPTLPDFLAEHGVRVVSEDGAR